MKILHVVGTYIPGWRAGGPIKSVSTLCSKLAERGHDVTVFTTNLDGTNVLDVPTDKTVLIDGVKVNYYKGRIPSYAFSVPLAKALKKNVDKFDLIHIHSIFYWPTLIASYYGKKHGVPYIITPRGMLDPACWNGTRLKKMLYGFLIEKFNFSGSGLLHFTSEREMKNSYLFGLNLPFRVVPNGIRPEDFFRMPEAQTFFEKYPDLKGKTIILFLARLNRIKGIDILSKAYGKLARERDDVHLVIAGPDQEGYGEKVKSWFKAEGVFKRVTFTGMLNSNEKLHAFAASDVFVLPSYSENFGMAVVEAMAAGVPVVISNRVGIHKEVEQNRAGIIVETVPESIYSGIKKLLDSPVIRGELIINGKRLVEDYYDINRVADMMIISYKEVIRYAG
jgi:glycosyltransferase involved in cell wall biosynthesis